MMQHGTIFSKMAILVVIFFACLADGLDIEVDVHHLPRSSRHFVARATHTPTSLAIDQSHAGLRQANDDSACLSPTPKSKRVSASLKRVKSSLMLVCVLDGARILRLLLNGLAVAQVLTLEGRS